MPPLLVLTNVVLFSPLSVDLCCFCRNNFGCNIEGFQQNGSPSFFLPSPLLSFFPSFPLFFLPQQFTRQSRHWENISEVNRPKPLPRFHSGWENI